MQATLKKRLDECKSLPVLPPVAVNVLRLTQRENFDIQDVAKAIGSNPALAAKVIGLVNSSLFGLRQEVRTVSHALILLGIDAVRTIALSFSLVHDMRSRGTPGLSKVTYWQRAIFAAGAAQELARQESLKHPEDAFLGALLQDVGMLAMAQATGEEYGALVARAHGDHERLAELELQAFGSDHAEVGRWLVASWQLPEPVRIGVGGSHDPARWQTGKNAAAQTLARVVALSGTIADLWIRADTREATRRLCTRAREFFGLDGTRVEKLLERVAKATVEISPLFEIQAGTADELEATLQRASLVIHNPKAEDGAVETVTAVPSGPVVRLDPLTGLPDARRLAEYVTDQLAFAQRAGIPLTLLCCEIDQLATLAEAFGRAAADRALIGVAALLSERLRYRDMAGREGLGTFMLVLPDTPPQGGLVVAERLRQRVADAAHDVGLRDPVHLTLSVGCVTFDETVTFNDAEDLRFAAEDALGRARDAGRNRVVSFATKTEG